MFAENLYIFVWSVLDIIVIDSKMFEISKISQPNSNGKETKRKPNAAHKKAMHKIYCARDLDIRFKRKLCRLRSKTAEVATDTSNGNGSITTTTNNNNNKKPTLSATVWFMDRRLNLIAHHVYISLFFLQCRSVAVIAILLSCLSNFFSALYFPLLCYLLYLA